MPVMPPGAGIAEGAKPQPPAAPRTAPTLRAVPRPNSDAPKPKPVDPPESQAKAAEPQAKREESAPASEMAEVVEVIRPMRIISIGTDTTPPSPPVATAPVSAPPIAAPPVSAPPVPSTPAIAKSPATPPPPPVSKPPKPPPVVEEVEAIEEVDEHGLDHAGPRGARTDEVDPIVVDDDEEEVEVGERISDVDITAHDAKPKKPPPPPPKRTTSDQPEASKAIAPSAAPTVDLSARKRPKPWWEEIFSDDYIHTMEKLDPKFVRKECDFIEDRLGLERGAIMLDLACGCGVHTVELATRGYNVVGYDLSLAMLATAQDEAQDRGQKINFLQGDMREMAFEEAFDGVYSWSTSFGYFEDEKNLNVLSRVHRALRQGGMFLLDVVNRDYVCPRQPSLVWFEGDGCVCMDEMHVDFITSRLRVKRTVMFEDGRSRECEYAIRLYGLHELGKMLHDTGFKVAEVTGHPAHPGVFFGSESPRIIVLAERG
jgi:SAM-dependent methyltransferase